MRAPLILDVNPDPAALEWEQEWLTRSGLPVVTCCGPETQGGCPLLQNRRCPKIDGADGVIFQLDLDRPEHRGILSAYTRELEVPIRVVALAAQQGRWADLLQSVELFTPPVGPAKLDAFAAEVAAEID